MKHLSRIGYSGLLLLALTAPFASYADEQPPQQKSEADIRWDASAPMVNLLLQDAPASKFMEQGDTEKSEWGNYAGALMYYLTATNRDPQNAFAPYQAAAALATLKITSQAKEYLKEADKRGFWQYYIANNDDEMASVSDSEEYKQLLIHTKARYDVMAKDAGQASIHIPKGKAPAGGWPVLVWLSGYGTEGKQSDGIAKVLGKRVVFIGINGTEKLDHHSFRWSRTDIKSTHLAIQNALTKAKKSTTINTNKVVLMGFSQGALHGAHLITDYSDHYMAALLLSPGGHQTSFNTAAPKGKRIVISYGEDEYASNLKLDKKLSGYFAKDNQLEVATHPGGHFFDKNWKTIYPTYLNTLFSF
ncbi:alpha/beta hydrolase [Vibrio tritonius]|uniref:alpha/beta hydrolase n=1 Tax=Vibrio tritonius TaxID=1435069 RepID=UPI000838F9B7|nr:hypothetical protein [Vibrio tritonius]